MIVRSSRTATMRLAFDKSFRVFDIDGHMHVGVSNISKANVCPYRGDEIPSWENLGLDPAKVYMLFRDPVELAKAAATSNGKPLLFIHKQTSAADHPKEVTVGTTGTDAKFVAPYLQNSLHVWVDEAIAGIDAEVQCELSSSYWYDADMAPGEFEGTPYDGVMRNIQFNHVALVETGRAGPDVRVFDSLPTAISKPAIKETPMAKLASRKALLLSGALGVYLKPKLAMDKSIDLSGILSGVTAKNFASKKKAIAAGINAKAKGKLAEDADLGDLDAVIEAVETLMDGNVEDDDLDQAMDDGEMTKKDDESDEEFEKRKKDFADKAKALKDEEDAKAAKAAQDKEGAKEPTVTKSAMDAALTAARTQTAADVRAQARRDARELRDAEEAVKPYVGAVVAMDSAEDVYRFAIEKIAPDVDLNGVPASALPSILKAHPVPGSQRTIVAMDSVTIARAETELALMSATPKARS